MAKKFQFRYQVLLEVRERRQKAEEEKLQKLLGEQALEQAELNRLKAEHATKWQELVDAQQAASLDLQSLVLYQNFLLGLETLIKRQQDAVDMAAARSDNQRELLVEAKREAEAILKLKERDEKVWREAIEKAEAELIDELATVRYGRNPL